MTNAIESTGNYVRMTGKVIAKNAGNSSTQFFIKPLRILEKPEHIRELFDDKKFLMLINKQKRNTTFKLLKKVVLSGLEKHVIDLCGDNYFVVDETLTYNSKEILNEAFEDISNIVLKYLRDEMKQIRKRL